MNQIFLASRKSITIASRMLVTICGLASQIVCAQMPGDIQQKAPAGIMEKMASGSSQDLIVVFDDKAIENETKKIQAAGDIPANESQIVARKVARYLAIKEDVLSSFSSSEAETLKSYSHLPIAFVRVHSEDSLSRLLAHPGIVGVYENEIFHLHLAESLPLIEQPQAVAQGDTGAGTAVAVIDSGVDYSQPAFGSCSSAGVPASCKVAYAKDFNPGSAGEGAPHGTNVAAIVAGVAPGTKIIDLKVFGSAEKNGQAIFDALNWVIANKSVYNIVAVNMSLGSGRYSAPLTSNSPYYSVVNQARAAGILIVASSGNAGYTDSIGSPAAVQGVISVGAVYDATYGARNWGRPETCQDPTTTADQVTCFSNSANFLTLLAPGALITAAGIHMGGTSQAAPHVAGAVATLRSAYPAETIDQTVARITNGAPVSDSRNDITKPRLDLQKALGLSTQCKYAVSQSNVIVGSGVLSGNISVTTTAGCPWSSASNSDWITVAAGSSGTGNGTVSYTIAANGNSFSRMGTLQIAGRSIGVSQSGFTGTVANILLNPDFENGPVSWASVTANGLPIVTTYNQSVPGNSWYAWLCGYDSCVDRLYQDITIPATAQSAFLQFNYWISSQETATTVANDVMTVGVYNPPGATASSQLLTLSNLNASNSWVQSQIFDLSAFKGQTIRIQFYATTNTSLPTDFYLDNVTLKVSGASTDQLAPTVPKGLVAIPVSTSAVSLTWFASSDNITVTGYRVYRDGSLIATLGNVSSYQDSGLLAGSAHSYTVSACDAVGNCSSQSGPVSISLGSGLTDTQAPTTPTGLRATAVGQTSINVSWNAAIDNVGVTSYKIYRNGSLLITLGAVTSYGDSGLSPSTRYSYTVSACDGAGNCSAQSTAVFATTESPSPLSTPVKITGYSTYRYSGNLANITIEKITNVSSSYTTGSLRIELWALRTPYTGGSITGYVTASIRTNAITGGSDQLAANEYFSNITLNLNYTAPPAAYDSYALFILEYDPANCSTTDSFCIVDYLNYHEIQDPTVPTGQSAHAISSSQVDLAWVPSTDNVGVTNYRIFRNGLLIAVVGNVTNFTDAGLAESTTYSYSIQACDAVENCSTAATFSSVTTPAAPDTTSPSVPTGLVATVVNISHINLTWNPATDNVAVASYKIYSGGTLVGTVGNATSSLRKNAPSSTYIYTIAACDTAGNCSARSIPASATTKAVATIGVLGTPADATTVSGIGVISGWHCTSKNIDVYVDGTFVSKAGAGTTLGTMSVCGRTDTGYSYLYNFSNLDNGQHTVTVYADGVLFDTHTVTTFKSGGTAWLTGANKTITVSDFPQAGQTATLQWVQSYQNFLITGISGISPGPISVPGVPSSPQVNVGVLGTPADATTVSGIGVISGWHCTSKNIDVYVDGIFVSKAGAGTTLGTMSVCGRTDTGYSYLYNFSNLDNGQHTVTVYADGVLFDTHTVTTFKSGGTAWLTGANKTITVSDFPQAGQTATLQWVQSYQNFLITGISIP